MTALLVVAMSGALAAAQTPAGAGVIAGRVVEERTNTPIAEARVMLVEMRAPEPGAIPPQREATSGSDGTFRFEGLAPGRYRLNVLKAGYVGLVPGAPPPPFITIEAGAPVAAPVIALQRGGVIAGRVLSPSGEPVAEARVMAMRRPPGAPAGRLAMSGPPAMTNDLGEFRLHSLAPGEYYVQATPRIGPPNARSTPSATMLAPTFYPGTTEMANAQPVTIGGGATLGSIEIGILQVPAFSIKGIVVDEAGAPVANAAVMLGADPSLGVPSFGGPSRTRTAADGTFSIEGVASGTYRLTAAAPTVSKAAAGGPERGSVGGTFGSGGIGGTAYMTETSNGVTTQYRFDSDAVSVVIQSNHVSGVQVTAKRPR